MPSCNVCGNWFSEEDGSCGCPGEVFSLRRSDIEEIKRQAKIEALEALPCDSVGGDCINQSKGVEPWWCLRCKVLAELKGKK